jgi:hypothetical protein
MQSVDGLVDGGDLAAHDVGAVFLIGLGDGFLDPFQRHLPGQHP